MKMTAKISMVLALALTATTSTGVLAKKKGGGKTDQWYLKMTLLVEDGEKIFYDDRSGVFGRLDGASETQDMHDVPVFQSARFSNAAIVFERSGEGWTGAQFHSNYLPADTESGRWDFSVFSIRGNADVTLVWDGLFRISQPEPGVFDTVKDTGDKTLNSLKLVDRETGEVIKAARKGVLGAYEFNMGGKTARYFRWVQGDVTADDTTPLTASAAPSALEARRAMSEALRSGPPGFENTPLPAQQVLQKDER